MLQNEWTTRPALLFYLWFLVFTGANIINCSSGWCDTMGFPLAWYPWSDDIVTFGDGRLDKVLTTVGVAAAVMANLLTFVVVGRALTRLRVPRVSSQ
jgi:hypothetical protein